VHGALLARLAERVSRSAIRNPAMGAFLRSLTVPMPHGVSERELDGPRL
jgi:hypothetical protein